MIELLDRSRRDSTLFQFCDISSSLTEIFTIVDHLLIRIDEQVDFANLVKPPKDCYCCHFVAVL